MKAVIVCAAVTALCAIMMPEDKTTGKYIKYISGLVSLSIIVSPLMSALRSPSIDLELPEAGSFDTGGSYDMNAAVLKKAERTLSETVREDVSSRFGIEKGDISVAVTLTSEDMSDVRIKAVTVTLSHYGAWADAQKIERYIKESYDKEAEVRIIYE